MPLLWSESAGPCRQHGAGGRKLGFTRRRVPTAGCVASQGAEASTWTWWEHSRAAEGHIRITWQWAFLWLARVV